jgi:hypothetical protein
MFKLINNIKNKQEARSFAIHWQNWQSTQALSYSEFMYYENYFRNLGKKFHLMTEFKENGII